MADALAPRRARRLVAAIVCVVVAADQISKALAIHYLAGRGVVDVAGGAFHLELYRNFAASGNRLSGHPELVSLLALVAVVALGLGSLRVRSRWTAVACGLMLGGGAGNLLDRLVRAPAPLRGGVVDWLKPTLSSGSMNLADVAITAGLAAMVLGAVVGWWRGRARPPVPDDRAGRA